MSDKVLQTPAINLTTGEAIVRVGDASESLVSISKLPDYWTGSQDVQPTDDQKVWRLAYPVVIDVGADKLHQTLGPDGSPIDGHGVTVALVDSGIFFDKHTKDVLGEKLEGSFVGRLISWEMAVVRVKVVTSITIIASGMARKARMTMVMALMLPVSFGATMLITQPGLL